MINQVGARKQKAKWSTIPVQENRKQRGQLCQCKKTVSKADSHASARKQIGQSKVVNHDGARETETKWSTMPVQENGKQSGQPCWCKKTGNIVVSYAGARKQKTKWSTMPAQGKGKQSGQPCGARKREAKWSTVPVQENGKQSGRQCRCKKTGN